MHSVERAVSNSFGVFRDELIIATHKKVREEASASESVANVLRQIGNAGIVMVLDPEEAQKDLADTLNRLGIASRMGIRAVLIGGSTDKNNAAAETIPLMSGVVNKLERRPLRVSFPGTASQVIEGDAVLSLFPPQMETAKNPEIVEYYKRQYLEIIKRAKELDMPILPTTYILFNGGKPTSVEKVTGIEAIDVKNGVNAKEIMQIITPWLNPGDFGILEMGSRPETSVDLSEVAEKVMGITGVPWIVTGGVNSVKLIGRITRNHPFPIGFGSVVEQTPPYLCPMLFREFMEAHPSNQTRYRQNETVERLLEYSC